MRMQKKSTALQFAAFATLFVIAVLAGAFVMHWMPGGAHDRQEFEKAWAQEIGPFTADAVCDAYENNPATFQPMKGRAAIVVSGTINDIDVDAAGNPFVTLGKGLLGAVKCTFEKQAMTAVGELKKGQAVSVKGIFEGASISKQIELSRCKLGPLFASP